MKEYRVIKAKNEQDAERIMNGSRFDYIYQRNLIKTDFLSIIWVKTMFGYVIPDKQNMYIKDFNVFQGYYCGLCRALGKTGGPLTRLCTNYDVTFYSVLLHSIAGVEPKIESKVCALNCKKKPMIEVDDLSLKSADVAVLLTYYNVVDDVEDGKKSRLPIKWRLNLRKKAASKRMPEVDALMKREFARLSQLEKDNSDSVDIVADCTAVVMRDMTKLLVET